MHFIRFTPATHADIPQIQSWIDAEKTHKGVFHPSFFLSGNPLTIFACKIVDESGVVFYLRFSLADEQGVSKTNIQFPAPESGVSKRRIMTALARGIPAVVKHLSEQYGVKGLQFDSESRPLIAAMKKFGFEYIGGDEYRMVFPEKNNAQPEPVDCH